MARSGSLRRSSGALTALVLVLLTLVPTAVAQTRVRLATEAGDRGSGPQLRAAAASSTGIAWSDVPKDHWARAAIDHVAGLNVWMRDSRPGPDGTYRFRPDALESRRLFARAIVRAFAPSEEPDPAIAFPDLADTEAAWRNANIAVKLGWIATDEEGRFLPTTPVTVRVVHRALVLALGLDVQAAGVDALHLRNGTKVQTPPGLGTLLIGMRLGLRYNHGDESLDVGPDDPLPRAEVAWSLYRAATIPSWVPSSLEPYSSIELPNLGPRAFAIVQFGVRYVGYPYVYGGEWSDAAPDGYCCGAQPVGGFDCSGISWWVLKAAASGWDNVPPRDYQGWTLPERSSAEMATAAPEKLRFDDLRPGDLMFYDGDGNRVVDHVDVYLGNGWSLDSSSSAGGVSIVKVDAGWYRDHFVFGRRILGT